MAAGEMSFDEYRAFLMDGFSSIAAYSLDGSLHYICIDPQHVADVTAAGSAVFDCLKTTCVWVKDNAGMESWSRLSEQNLRYDKWSVCRG